MSIELSKLTEVKSAWIELSGPFSGMELLVRSSTPRGSEKFRQKLVRRGVLKHGKHGTDLAPGRDGDFFAAYVDEYVLDWRGDCEPKEYDRDLMVELLCNNTDLLGQLSLVLEGDSDFFVSDNGG